MENKISGEEKNLIDALNNYGESYDVTVRLADLNLNKGRRGKAYYYYLKALELCEDENIRVLIKRNLLGLWNESEVISYTKRKKILVIAHIFPPLGGSGVQRTLKFVKYLREFNYEPIVVTVGKVAIPYLMDESLFSDVPEDIEIIRIDEPSGCSNYELNYLVKLYKEMVNDTNLMIQYVNFLAKENNSSNFNFYSMPDMNSAWGVKILETINELVDFDSIDAIYSTSGPYTDHMVAYALKKTYKKPWIADFRDEWTNNPYFEYDDTNLFSRMRRCMERSMVSTCDKMLIISSISRQNYIDIFNLSRDKVISITNGYDEDDFKEISIKSEKNDKFTIVHNGIFYLIRTPETFLEAIKNLIESKRIPKDKIKIIFSYTEDSERWKNYLRENELEDIVEFKEYMEHKESMELAINSDMLLLVVGHGDKNKSVYTGKVFEYLRMKRHILALAPKGSLIDDLMKETKCGKVVEFYDIFGIENYILTKYFEWEKDIENTFIEAENIEKYERKNLTKRLADIFDELLAEKNN